jgi:hypothetical protein
VLLEHWYYLCPRCGHFGLTLSAEAALPALLVTNRRRSVLSYAIRRTPPSGVNTKLFDHLECQRLVEADYLPTPQEEAENLIRWIGARLSGPGENISIHVARDFGVVGAQSAASMRFVITGLETSGLLQCQHNIDGTSFISSPRRGTWVFGQHFHPACTS